MIGRLRSFLVHAALRLWPLRFGLGRVIRVVGLPEPGTTFATRSLRGLPLRLQFDPRSCQGRFLYYRGLYEERSILKLRELLRPGMTVVDAWDHGAGCSRSSPKRVWQPCCGTTCG